MKVINKTNSKIFVEYVLKSKGNLEINRNTNDKLDFIVTNKDTNKEYGIIVRYRNIPCTETRSQVLDKETLSKLGEICDKEKRGLIPTIAFLIFDEEKKTTYVYITTVENLKSLSKNSDVEALTEVMHGSQIKYGIGLETRDELLNSLKKKLDCTEIINSTINFFDVPVQKLTIYVIGSGRSDSRPAALLGTVALSVPLAPLFIEKDEQGKRRCCEMQNVGKIWCEFRRLNLTKDNDNQY